ncbi:helix-turn-helix domain-containing protein [Neobacillus cucumis]|uniref:RQC domain-containing protein n=1 Tax=Neobacillus cucumis TaxID=1740721 RepID=A0A2N5H992_9BACI|nr:helix-turn-helix domain-containing protein [Neobacillus cucumis]PLS02093.1 RQC domain-containing protein [Neobacillus cucumis]
MLQIKTVILYCLKQLNKERTIYSIYHLLNGKKSSQTIQDAHLFSLKEFFGIYESLTRETFEKITEELFRENFIESFGEQKYQLTAFGRKHLEHISKADYLNGWDYHSFTATFWERLSLLIQVTSNLVYQETKYIPIQKNKEVHNWLKLMLKEIKVPRKELGSVLFTELIECLNEAKDIDPSILVFRLTGYQKIGLTPLQTARKLNLDEHNYHLEFINILHYLLQKITKDSNRFMVLPFLIKDLEKENELTITSRKTWALLKQGFNPEKIAAIRNLKLSTIEDHLVEFALHLENFSIDTYVDRDLQKKIIELSRGLGTRQLKLIKDQLRSATYLQIRLVLAKYGD